MKTGSIVHCLDTAYPTIGALIEDASYEQPPHSTCFGYVLKGKLTRDNRTINQGSYFCLPAGNVSHMLHVSDVAFVVTRLGYKGMTVEGSDLEDVGRLSYIDGCSSTILVYPPRIGDPSFHHLHFPPRTKQTKHLHPSVRIGMIIKGSGVACVGKDEIDLVPGTIFALDQMEEHRFCTGKNSMDLVVYHPDGSWGPQDEDHPMLNKTLLRARPGPKT